MAAVRQIGIHDSDQKVVHSAAAIGEERANEITSRTKADVHEAREPKDCNGDAVCADMIQPGMVTRPELDLDQARQLVDELYGLTVTNIKELNGFVDRNFWVQVSSEHRNSYLAGTGLWPHGYTLKFLNSMDSRTSHVEAEHDVLAILDSARITCPQPVTSLQGQDKALVKIENPLITNNTEATVAQYDLHTVRLMQYIPGRILAEVPYTPKLLYDTGKQLALIHEALKGFHHPALLRHSNIFCLKNIPQLKDFAHSLRPEEHKQLIFDIIQVFAEEVLPAADQFPCGPLHGDFNPWNIIVETVPQGPGGEKEAPAKDECRISGVIDFGHASESCYVYDVAITIMYMMLGSTIVPPTSVGGHVLAGYLAHRKLTEQEFDVLKLCVASRFAQSLTMGDYTLSRDPDNEYAVITAKNGWQRLKEMWAVPKEELYSKWRRIIQEYAV